MEQVISSGWASLSSSIKRGWKQNLPGGRLGLSARKGLAWGPWDGHLSLILKGRWILKKESDGWLVSYNLATQCISWELVRNGGFQGSLQSCRTRMNQHFHQIPRCLRGILTSERSWPYSFHLFTTLMWFLASWNLVLTGDIGGQKK